MDTLSRLIELARPQGSLDLRCLLGGGFSIDHEPMQAGVAPFHLVLGGACVIESGGQSLSLNTGDFVLFPRGAAHRVRDVGHAAVTRTLSVDHDGMLPLRSNVDDDSTGDGRAKNAAHGAAKQADLDLLCGRFVYAPGSAALLLDALPDPLHVPLADLQSAGTLQALIGLMRSESERRQPGALAIVTALSHALFTMALRVHGERQAGTASVLALLADARLGASVEAMLAAPERAWTIAELGERAAMSRATYARHFNERAGITVMDFLTRIRMTIACDLLRRTQRSAADIGEAVGYQSEAAFGKAFQQSVGETPGRYRRAPERQLAQGSDDS